MAAVTSTIVALGGLGLSAAQAFDAAKDKKDASQAAKIAKNQLESIKQENKYKALQAPDISSMAFERNAQAQADTLKTLSEMGPEGAAQATAVEQANRNANLAAAEKQGQINYDRDAMVAEQEQNIEDARVDREEFVAWEELQGAQLAASDAEKRQADSITNTVDSLGDVISGLGEATSLEAKAQRAKRRSGRGNLNDVKSTIKLESDRINNDSDYLKEYTDYVANPEYNITS